MAMSERSEAELIAELQKIDSKAEIVDGEIAF